MGGTTGSVGTRICTRQQSQLSVDVMITPASSVTCHVSYLRHVVHYMLTVGRIFLWKMEVQQLLGG